MERYLSQKLKEKGHNAPNKISGELESSIYDNSKNYEMPYILHNHKTVVYLDISKMCDFSSDKHALSRFKYVLHYCSKCPIIVTPNQIFTVTPKTCALQPVFRCTK